MDGYYPAQSLHFLTPISHLVHKVPLLVGDRGCSYYVPETFDYAVGAVLVLIATDYLIDVVCKGTGYTCVEIYCFGFFNHLNHL